MRILIVKDAATRIPREVADRAEALAIQASGFTVLEVGPDDVARPLVADELEKVPAEDPAAQQSEVQTASTISQAAQTKPSATPAKKTARPPTKKAAAKR